MTRDQFLRSGEWRIASSGAGKVQSAGWHPNMPEMIHEIDGMRVLELTTEGKKLRTGAAGEIVQKFVGYGMRVAFFGDISEHVAGSKAFRDFVRGANSGKHSWFAANFDDLHDRLP